jgi:hypothetical protein
MLSSYARQKAGYASWSDGLQWTEVGVGAAGAAALLYAGPQAAVTVPITIGVAVVATGLKVAREEVDGRALAQNRELLRAYQGEIIRQTGLDYPEIRQAVLNDPAAAYERFTSGTDVFRDLRRRAGGDPDLQRASVEMMLDTIANTTAAQLEATASNTARIDDLEVGLVHFADQLRDLDKRMDDRLDEAETAIDRIEGSVSTLQGAVRDLDGRVGSLEADQAVIADFVFDQMPAAEKVRLLTETNFMSARFQCPPPAETCEASELKDSLVARFEAEAEFDAVIQDVATVTGALNDISTIATNLGVELPKEVGVAINVANVAVAALSATTGLGAIAAISGLAGAFGGGGDGDAERHRQLLAYLDRRFDAIDARLKEIAENQVRLMQAVGELSRQMQESFQRMDRTLARMEFEQLRMGEGVRALIWEPWRACYDVSSVATRSGSDGLPLYVEAQTLDFTSEDALRAVVRQTAEFSALPCLQVMQPALTSVSAPRRFGNFTDLRWVLENVPIENAAPDELGVEEVAGEQSNGTEGSAPQVDWRSRLLAFDQDVFSPALQSANRFVQDVLGNRAADAFALLTRPMFTTEDWRGALASLQQDPLTCWAEPAHREQRLCPLLSPAAPGGGRKDPNQQAAELLARPVLADVVIEVADWVILMSQIADRRNQERQEWVYIDDQLERLTEGVLPPKESNGERLMEGAIDMLDIAIASYAMTYGPLPARVAANDFLTGADPETLVRSFRANAYLARNAVQMILEDLNRETNGQNHPPEGTYRDLYEHALNETSGRFLFLEQLFGKRASFAATEDGEPGFLFSASSGNIVVPLPPPDALTSGRLVMPPRYTELLAVREQLVDRLFGYRILDAVSPGHAETLAGALLQ